METSLPAWPITACMAFFAFALWRMAEERRTARKLQTTRMPRAARPSGQARPKENVL